MPRALVKFRPPELGGPLKYSTEFPDAKLSILSAYATNSEFTHILEVKTSDRDSLIEYINDGEIASPVEILHDDDAYLVLRLKLPFVPEGYQALFESDNLPEFPYRIEDGWMVGEVTTSHERLATLRDEIEAKGMRFDVVLLKQSLDPSTLLSDRQRKVMTTAIGRGYYDTPRGCSLTALADELDVSKSSLSGVLHRAEERVIKHFFSSNHPSPSKK